MTSFLGVPVMVRGEVFGNLYLTDKRVGRGVHRHRRGARGRARGRRPASRSRTPALHARASAISRCSKTASASRMDLHDTVIQQLFAIGLSLQATLRLLDPEVARRVQLAVDDLDTTIKRIRSTIFALDAPVQIGGSESLRRRVITLLSEMTPTLRVEPRTFFDGAVDALTDQHIADELLTVVREALSNVARHAEASEVEVHLIARDGTLTLRVEDNGVGPPAAPGEGRGLRNMQARGTPGRHVHADASLADWQPTRMVGAAHLTGQPRECSGSR